MKNGKTIGPYSIPVYLLKILSEYIAAPFCDIINDSFSSGVFPDLMKLAKVVPLYKKSSPENPNNYEPISFLFVFSKIVEKLTWLHTYLEKHNILHSLQFGFRSKHRTLHALISLTGSVKMMECLNLVYLLIYERHLILLTTQFFFKKMEHYGSWGTALKWFTLYWKTTVCVCEWKYIWSDRNILWGFSAISPWVLVVFYLH